MSANIHGFAYIDAPAWHGLGNNILAEMQGTPADQRIALARTRAGLDYKVVTEPIMLADGTPMPDYKATVRVDPDGTRTPFRPVGKGYEVIQAEQVTEMAEILATRWGAVPSTAAALGSGEKAFLLMRLADAKVTPLPGDDSRGYVLLSWSHDGETAVKLLPTLIRVVCANTLAMAMSAARGKSWGVIRHTASASAKLDAAAKLMDRTMEAMQATGDTFATMARKRLDGKQLLDYIAKAIPNTTAAGPVAPVIQARRDTVLQLVTAGRGAAMANQLVDVSDGGASVWAAYNAVTEYFDHVRPAEAQSDAGRRNAFESALFGGNAAIKADALTLGAELAAAL